MPTCVGLLVYRFRSVPNSESSGVQVEIASCNVLQASLQPIAGFENVSSDNSPLQQNCSATAQSVNTPHVVVSCWFAKSTS